MPYALCPTPCAIQANSSPEALDSQAKLRLDTSGAVCISAHHVERTDPLAIQACLKDTFVERNPSQNNTWSAPISSPTSLFENQKETKNTPKKNQVKTPWERTCLLSNKSVCKQKRDKKNTKIMNIPKKNRSQNKIEINIETKSHQSFWSRTGLP